MQAKRQLTLLASLILGMLVSGTLVSCTEPLLPSKPFIALSPEFGEAGTRITVSGKRFPSETPLSVRLGPPSVGATPKSYGDVITDANGAFELTVVIPERWPDGGPIVEQELVVVVLNQDGCVKAIAPFELGASLANTLAPPPETTTVVEGAILTWHREGGAPGFCDDLAVFADGRVWVSSCRQDQKATVVERQLSDQQLASLLSRVESDASFQFEESGGVGVYRLTIRMAFAGKGSREVLKAERQALQAFLTTLFPSQ